MKRFVTVLGAIALVGLTLGTASADVAFQMGMNVFFLGNDEYSRDPAVNPAFAPGGWTATTHGAIWMATTGGSPVINTQDLNIQLDFRSTPTSPWITVTGAYLLSNHVADGDCNWLAYPGQFGGCDGALGPIDHSSPYRHPGPSGEGGANMGEYVLPGTGPTAENPYGQDTQPGMQFDLYLWTGNFNTFSAAAAGGAKVADSGAFQVGTTSYGANFFDYGFINMPSMLLQPIISGDANYDGKVDINDLTRVLTNYNQTASMRWSTGDFNGDGKVDINDLTIVLAHYNQSLASSAGMAPVPEPGALALLAAAMIGLWVYALRKGK
jgi:hypothetical protein